MSQDWRKPVESIEEFEAILAQIGPAMDSADRLKTEGALETLKERGMPDPSTYLEGKLIAEDMQDLNVKVALLILRGEAACLKGHISTEDMAEHIMPILEGILDFVMEHGPHLPASAFPLTIDLTPADDE